MQTIEADGVVGLREPWPVRGRIAVGLVEVNVQRGYKQREACDDAKTTGSRVQRHAELPGNELASHSHLQPIWPG
jgi:hypothetical protein